MLGLLESVQGVGLKVQGVGFICVWSRVGSRVGCRCFLGAWLRVES